MKKTTYLIMPVLAAAVFFLCPLCLNGYSSVASNNAVDDTGFNSDISSSFEQISETISNIQNTQDTSNSSSNLEYTYTTPFTVNNPWLVPIPQVLYDYENWINSKGYLNTKISSPHAGWNKFTDDERHEFIHYYDSVCREINIMSCALISGEGRTAPAELTLDRFYDRFKDEPLYNRKIYLTLVDYWPNDDSPENKNSSSIEWVGSRHVIFWVGTDALGNELVYDDMSYGRNAEENGSIFDNSLTTPANFTKQLTTIGFNLRNANHLKPLGKVSENLSAPEATQETTANIQDTPVPTVQESQEISEYIQTVQTLAQSPGTDKYTYVTPFMNNNSNLVPIPQVLLNYENWINTQGYLNIENKAFDAYWNRETSEQRKADADNFSRQLKQINFMACALISEGDALFNEYNSKYENYYVRYGEEFHDRKIYLALVDYWLNDDYPDTELNYNGNRHEIYLVGTDSFGNEVIYDTYSPDERGNLLFNNTLVSPSYFTREATEGRFNLRNSNHLLKQTE